MFGKIKVPNSIGASMVYECDDSATFAKMLVDVAQTRGKGWKYVVVSTTDDDGIIVVTFGIVRTKATNSVA